MSAGDGLVGLAGGLASFEDRLPHRRPMLQLARVLAQAGAVLEVELQPIDAATNPLRVSDAQGRPRVPACAAVELAAQAMALQASMVAVGAGAGRAAGFLAAVRDLSWTRPWLDDAAQPLAVRVERLAGDGAQAICGFELRAADGSVCASGRLTVVVDPDVAAHGAAA